MCLRTRRSLPEYPHHTLISEFASKWGSVLDAGFSIPCDVTTCRESQVQAANIIIGTCVVVVVVLQRRGIEKAETFVFE